MGQLKYTYKPQTFWTTVLELFLCSALDTSHTCYQKCQSLGLRTAMIPTFSLESLMTDSLRAFHALALPFFQEKSLVNSLVILAMCCNHCFKYGRTWKKKGDEIASQKYHSYVRIFLNITQLLNCMIKFLIHVHLCISS